MTRTVREALAEAGPTISFEFMPPKTDEDERRIWKTIRELEPLQPSFVSVTYGAGGSTRDNTIRGHRGDRPRHDAAAGRAPDRRRPLRRRAARASSGGSPTPASSTCWRCAATRPATSTASGSSTPRASSTRPTSSSCIRAHGDFCVGVAAFPYKHPRSAYIEADTEWFVAKCRAGADYAITQMFFDADDYLRLRDRVVAAGCDTPIIAGLMPVTNMSTIARSEQLSGAPFPPHLRAAVRRRRRTTRRRCARSASSRRSLLAQRLLDEGVPGLHFITFNFSKATREVYAGLSIPARV